MNQISAYLCSIMIGYLLGCSNMALYLSKMKHIDITKAGSGNLGASNAMVVLGWKAGIITGIHDIGKAFIAVIIARYLFPDEKLVGVLAGVSCIMGHMYPFYLKFKGGKGLASYIGMTIALNWKLAACVCILLVLITVITDYIVIGTVTTVISVPAYMGFIGAWTTVMVLMIATSVILIKHKDNYVRIYNGTEIGLRRANRGDFRKTKQ